MTSAPQQVAVQVPATSANLGPGFDTCGLALDWYDRVTAIVTDSGFDVEVTGEGAGEVPTDSSHLVIATMLRGLESLQHKVSGLSLRTPNSIPHGRGLGSSAAAVVTGLALAHALARPEVDLDRRWLLAEAAEIEGHPDNVAATILGGFTLAWQHDGGTNDESRAEAVTMPIHPDVAAVVFVPTIALPTEHARAVLPSDVPHASAAANAGRAALLTHALTNAPELLLPATRDWLHQQQRSSALGASFGLMTRLRDEGHAAVISGAGPTVLVLGTEGSLAVLGEQVGFARRMLRPGVGVQVWCEPR